jgi:gliding motility-associated lipoprotein GldH
MKKRTRQIKIFLLLSTAVLLFTACGNQTVFKEYREMEKVSWNRFDIQFFEVPVHQGDILDFYLFLRHHTYYPYDHLDVNVTFYKPGGEMRSGDFHYELKDENGKWKADGMGELWDIELPVQQNLKFSGDGICKVRVENKMTKLETPGIIEIGLIVKKGEAGQ